MDERFFNHLGPFYETTPPIPKDEPILTNEKITERSETVLPQVVNNDVNWAPTEVNDQDRDKCKWNFKKTIFFSLESHVKLNSFCQIKLISK